MFYKLKKLLRLRPKELLKSILPQLSNKGFFPKNDEKHPKENKQSSSLKQSKFEQGDYN